MNKYLIGFIIIILLLFIFIIVRSSAKKETYYRTYLDSLHDPQRGAINTRIYNTIKELNAVEERLMTTLSIKTRNELVQRREELLKKIKFSYGN